MFSLIFVRFHGFRVLGGPEGGPGCRAPGGLRAGPGWGLGGPWAPVKSMFDGGCLNGQGTNPVKNSVKNPVKNSVKNPVNNSVKNSVENSVNNSVNNLVKTPVSFFL